jgi:hypothetical protein
MTWGAWAGVNPNPVPMCAVMGAGAAGWICCGTTPVCCTGGAGAGGGGGGASICRSSKPKGVSISETTLSNC